MIEAEDSPRAETDGHCENRDWSSTNPECMIIARCEDELSWIVNAGIEGYYECTSLRDGQGYG
jgi:hypothetical protein